MLIIFSQPDAAGLSEFETSHPVTPWVVLQLLSHISMNLLVFYHKCCSLIGFAARYLFNK